jgi:hypothetical protein
LLFTQLSIAGTASGGSGRSLRGGLRRCDRGDSRRGERPESAGEANGPCRESRFGEDPRGDLAGLPRGEPRDRIRRSVKSSELLIC